jgi:hypothetical protein
MFAILEKNGERRAVHSVGDLSYMLARGWQKIEPPKETTRTLHLPKKRGRPPKRVE